MSSGNDLCILLQGKLCCWRTKLRPGSNFALVHDEKKICLLARGFALAGVSANGLISQSDTPVPFLHRDFRERRSGAAPPPPALSVSSRGSPSAAVTPSFARVFVPMPFGAPGTAANSAADLARAARSRSEGERGDARRLRVIHDAGESLSTAFLLRSKNTRRRASTSGYMRYFCVIIPP